MVQLRILSGKKAGSSWDARRFPVRIGRSPQSDLQLEEPGVWNEHLKIELQHSVVRNGDTIEMGSVKLQFWLSEAQQRTQSVREVFVWAVIIFICLAQI